MKKPSATRAQLAHKVKELEAQLASTYHFASQQLPKASTDYLMASGVLVQLHYIGGKELMMPVVVKDGLSAETIKALQADLKRSYDLATMFKPKEA